MRPVLALALVALCGRAAAEDRIRKIEATGQADVVGDPLAASGQAKDDALRSCVQQVAGAIATAATDPDQAQLLSDRILARSAGYVRSFETLESRQEGNTWTTRLRCQVLEGTLEDELLAAGIAYRRAGMPRVLVLVAEQPIDAAQATGWWQRSGGGDDLRVLERALVDRLQRSGFTAVDLAASAARVKLDAIGADPDVAQARELGARTGAELVVIGRATARRLGEVPVDGGTLWSAQASVAARAVRVDTGAVVAAIELAAAGGSAFERAAAGRASLSEAGRQLGRELFTRVGRAWTGEGTRRIAVNVTGVSDYARLAAFKGALAQGVRGVKDVQERSLEDGRAELVVTVAGTPEELATELATRRFEGFTVKVRGTTATAVELELP